MMPSILIVDDDRHIGELSRLIFKTLGYEIVQVLDGKNLLDIVKQVDPVLILMDIYLPSGYDGWELTRLIRSQERFDELPVIAFTAAGAAVDESQAAASGFNGLIRKPFSRTEMRDYLSQFLDVAV